MRNSSNYSCSDYNMLCVKKYKRKIIWQILSMQRRDVIGLAISVFVYCVNKIFLRNIEIYSIKYFCQCYLNDLVCPLFFLGFCRIILKWAGYNISSYKEFLLLGMSSGMFWEYIAPMINKKAVSDPLDLFCYFVGINIYFFIIYRGNIKFEKRNLPNEEY